MTEVSPLEVLHTSNSGSTAFKAPVQPWGFFQLPRELRDQIYSYLIDDTPILLCMATDFNHRARDNCTICGGNHRVLKGKILPHNHQLQTNIASMMRMCRSLRHELQEEYFTRQIFHISRGYGHSWHGHRKMSCVCPLLFRHVQHITFGDEKTCRYVMELHWSAEEQLWRASLVPKHREKNWVYALCIGEEMVKRLNRRFRVDMMINRRDGRRKYHLTINHLEVIDWTSDLYLKTEFEEDYEMQMKARFLKREFDQARKAKKKLMPAHQAQQLYKEYRQKTEERWEAAGKRNKRIRWWAKLCVYVQVFGVCLAMGILIGTWWLRRSNSLEIKALSASPPAPRPISILAMRTSSPQAIMTSAKTYK